MKTSGTKAAEAGRLLVTGCPEKCIAEPVGPSLAGSSNGARHGLRFFRRQSNGKDNRDTFFESRGRPIFFFIHK